ncbi:TetR/AcrR family transcriptional regulator [Mycobacterium sp. CPCC 205372]|uniref:TetR/AcrR family transcriptional regulator n=1 Tax=Mycobacterium hippophais TaxID=3016340 RepID=A0ABT4PUH9_9MYCO|nr:TetR/AcrR family transcriptional regulator [Mycobacterium hippophais]MCZ8380237.1 TetR/AcrR family transcriptional regulator [Mycobacterium hippophais]
MANVRTPRSAWVDAALEALSAGGPDAVRVEALATKLGVSKGGFYWHFSDRQALLDEMLNSWETTMVDNVIALIESQPADPRARLRHLFELASSVDIAVELAVRDWSRRDRDVASRLRRVDNRRMNYLRSLFKQICADDDDADARSMLTFSLFIGSPFIAAQPGDRTRSQMVKLAVDRLLSESWA